MSKFSYHVIIPHNKSGYEISIQGNTAIKKGGYEEQAKGLHGPVKVSIKNLQDKDAQFSAVTTYTQLSALLDDARTYFTAMNFGIERLQPGQSTRTDLLQAHKAMHDFVVPAVTALYNIAKGKNNHGLLVCLDGASKEAIEAGLTEEEATAFSGAMAAYHLANERF